MIGKSSLTEGKSSGIFFRRESKKASIRRESERSSRNVYMRSQKFGEVLGGRLSEVFETQKGDFVRYALFNP